MSPVRIRPVQTRKELRQFVDLPYRLHRDDPVWVPPLRITVREHLSRQENPFFEHADAEYFIAEREGVVVGRIAAIHNRSHDEIYRDRVGFFGFFECENAQDAADALLDAASRWLSGRGLSLLRGPMSFSLNDECGLVVHGFEVPPTLLCPYSPRYYVDLLEDAGFSKAKDLLHYQSKGNDLPPRLAKSLDRVAARQGVSLRPVNLSRFDEEVARIKSLYNAAWEQNWGFIPFTEGEIDVLVRNLRRIVISDLVVFAEKDGQTIGLGAAVPDINEVLRKNRSGRLIPGLIRMLFSRRRIRRMRVLVLGVIPEFRRAGIDALICQWIWNKGVQHGFRWADAGWILEDNAPMNNALRRMGFEHHKTLRIYERRN